MLFSQITLGAAFSMGGVTDIFEFAMEQMDRPKVEALEEKGMHK
jgi:hypothetical protein